MSAMRRVARWIVTALKRRRAYRHSFQFTKADVADIGMMTELYWASPDGQADLASKLGSLPDGTLEVSNGRLIGPDDPFWDEWSDQGDGGG